MYQISFGDTLKTVYALVLETASETMTLYSDGSETWKDSEITYSNLFIGEVIDSNIQMYLENAVNDLVTNYKIKRRKIWQTKSTQCQALHQ